jgi:hypothetical protein
MTTKGAQWQAAFRSRMREAGLKAVTVWLPPEGVALLKPYSELERSEVITRALKLLEKTDEGESTGKLIGKLTSNEPLKEAVQGLVAELLAGPLARLEQLEAYITGNSTSKLTSNEIITSNLTPKLTGNSTGEVLDITGESTGKFTGKYTTEQLASRAVELREQGLSWTEITRRWNAEGIPTPSGKGQWHDSNIARLVKAAKGKG